MLTLAGNLRIYLHTQPTDMRKSFDGLSGVVRGVFQADPSDSSLFLFINRRRDRIKMLWWDRDGLTLFYKKQETESTQIFVFTGVNGTRYESPSACGCSHPIILIHRVLP